MSIAGGVENAVFDGRRVACEAIAMFTKNNNQWRAKALTKDDADRFNAALVETGIRPVVAHSSYLINLGSPDRRYGKIHRVDGRRAGDASCLASLTSWYILARTKARVLILDSSASQKRWIRFTPSTRIGAS
jgi:hypothetical protein